MKLRANSKLTQNQQFKKDLSKYEINYHLDSVFKYRPDDQEADVSNLKGNYWHQRQGRYTTTGQIEAKKATESDDERVDDMHFEEGPGYLKQSSSKMYDELRKLSMAESTVMSKGAQLSSCLDYMEGDVTITDKFGVIRGTFLQNGEN